MNGKPRLPFDGFKWRWAAHTPTEGLLVPSVFIGVLKVLMKNENLRFASNEVYIDLKRIEVDLHPSVTLARTPERNLFRNSQQYWKALGLLGESPRGIISISEFGRKVASGYFSHTEFSAYTIQTLELPNRYIETNETILKWDQVGVRIKPLELILRILSNLIEESGNNQGYLTKDELCDIVIPLSGVNCCLNEYTKAIFAVREGHLDISDWPNCTPRANDRRMAAEFLLFLDHYGYCNKIRVGGEDRFFLDSIEPAEVREIFKGAVSNIHDNKGEALRTRILEINETKILENIDRRRMVREIFVRPYQSQFRKNILKAYGATCLISGTSITQVLQAAHIKPVSYEGPDLISNGLCLRADLHTLYDANKIRILPDGSIHYNEEVKKDISYMNFTDKIQLPEFVSDRYLEWRYNYY